MDNENQAPDINGEKAALIPGIGKKPTKKQRLKKAAFAAAFILFNALAIGVILYLELKDGGGSFVRSSKLFEILGKNYMFAVLAFIMYAVHVFCDAFAYHALIRQCGYGNRFALALRVAVLGKYYDNITPWSTGGQPFQIAYMVKANIDTPTACTLPIVKYAIRLFFVNALIIMFFIFAPVKISLAVQITAYFGMFATAFLPVLLIIFSRNVPLMLKITRGVVKFLYKIKIVKNYEKQLGKAQDLMDSFLAAFKYLGKHKSMIIVVGLLSFLDILSVSSMPYLIIRSFGGEGEFFTSVTRALYATLSAGVVPTPGASGAAEGSFYSVFESAVPAGYLFWAVLFWRLLVFYMPILLGLMIHLFDWIKGKSKVSLVKSEIAWRFKKTFNLAQYKETTVKSDKRDVVL